MRASVAVVITTYNDAHFLPEALGSVVRQTRPADEIIVVDDGSEVDPGPVIASFRNVRVIRKCNGGLASARNAGLHATGCSHVLFLDADDRLTSSAVVSGLACLAAEPGAVFAFGGHRRINAAGVPLGPDRFEPLAHGFGDLLTGNRIGMHATVLYRRDALLTAGGFDEQLRLCEDYDAYLRLSRVGAVTCHPTVVAEYRWHGKNMSKDPDEMLAAVLDVHARYRPEQPDLLLRWQEGRRNFTEYYKLEAASMMSGRQAGLARSTLKRVARGIRRRLSGSWPPPVGKVRSQDLAGDRPVSLDFGWDRGLPIDRYYIERFLADNAGDIAGRVLEIGDAAYSRRFGGSRIERQDVLHVSAEAAQATIIGSLSVAGTLPCDAFDCIVLTQTLHLIFEIDAALAELARALRPGGVLLLTVPGISQIDRGEWGETWYWSFTSSAIRRLLSARYPADELAIEAHGNVFAATSYLHGLAVQEVDTRRLDPVDLAFPVIITARARRPLADA